MDPLYILISHYERLIRESPGEKGTFTAKIDTDKFIVVSKSEDSSSTVIQLQQRNAIGKVVEALKLTPTEFYQLCKKVTEERIEPVQINFPQDDGKKQGLSEFESEENKNGAKTAMQHVYPECDFTLDEIKTEAEKILQQDKDSLEFEDDGDTKKVLQQEQISSPAVITVDANTIEMGKLLQRQYPDLPDVALEKESVSEEEPVLPDLVSEEENTEREFKEEKGDIVKIMSVNACRLENRNDAEGVLQQIVSVDEKQGDRNNLSEQKPLSPEDDDKGFCFQLESVDGQITGLQLETVGKKENAKYQLLETCPNIPLLPVLPEKWYMDGYRWQWITEDTKELYIESRIGYSSISFCLEEARMIRPKNPHCFLKIVHHPLLSPSNTEIIKATYLFLVDIEADKLKRGSRVPTDDKLSVSGHRFSDEAYFNKARHNVNADNIYTAYEKLRLALNIPSVYPFTAIKMMMGLYATRQMCEDLALNKKQYRQILYILGKVNGIDYLHKFD